ncbi:hypothetical protein EIP91_005312 [Steccherinum ochraceum]|uniref:Uncharacterized protein n=1 Tax=Steccherinum ochraceum TaxID=92696 RepID=A0A4R0R7B8_9APHY|nr:hypothetical protein EIP91_005312 [Steccherinum ochraceum]
MASKGDQADLAPSEIWDVVKVLNDKLKATRDQLEQVQMENKLLQGKLEEYESSLRDTSRCNLESCASAIKLRG